MKIKSQKLIELYTTMQWIECRWQCDTCSMQYDHYTTFCRDWCWRINISDAKGNLIKNESIPMILS